MISPQLNHWSAAARCAVIACAAVVALATAAMADVPPLYSLMMLPDADGLTVRRSAINDASQVVGVGTTSDGSSTGWLWEGGNLWTFDELVDELMCGPGINCLAYDINNHGDIVGSKAGSDFILMRAPLPEPSAFVFLAFGALVIVLSRTRSRGGIKFSDASLTLLCYWLTSIAPPTASADHFNFSKVADSATPMPGTAGTGEFDGFAPPALDNGHVAFYGVGGGSEGNTIEGIYTNIGGPLARVADTTTPLPVFFEGMALEVEPTVFEIEPTIEAGTVVFLAHADGLAGVYQFDAGISVVADSTTIVPGTSDTFLLFGLADKPAMHDGQVVFVGTGLKPSSGVYRNSNGILSVVVDTNTPVPNGTGTFELLEFDNVATHSGRVAFIGNADSDPGIYLSEAGSLSVVADGDTPVPGASGEQFVAFGSISGGVDVDASTIAFLGFSDETAGVYGYDLLTGEIRTVADMDTAIPSGDGGTFDGSFSSVSISEGRVAFGYGATVCSPFLGCMDTPGFGVYADLGSALEKVIAAGDVLDGRVVERAFIGAEGLRGDHIAFWTQFADGTEGIYVATISVPEPCAWALLTVANPLALAAGRARRHAGLAGNGFVSTL